MAQPFHHTILPLATLADRRTEIRWGLRDFEWRFGRRPAGVWLPGDRGGPRDARAARRRGRDPHDPRAVAARRSGAGHAAAVPGRRRRRPVDRRASPTTRGSRRRSPSRSRRPATPTGSRASGSCRGWPSPWTTARATPFALIATDGELYGHHQPYRDLFLQRLVGPADLGFEVATLADVVAEAGPSARPADHRRAELVELPSRRRPLGDRVRLRRRRGVEGAAASRVRPARRGDRHPDRGDRPVPARRARPVGGARRLRRRRDRRRWTRPASSPTGCRAPTRRRGAPSRPSWPRSAGASRCTRAAAGSGRPRTGSRPGWSSGAATHAATLIDGVGRTDLASDAGVRPRGRAVDRRGGAEPRRSRLDEHLDADCRHRRC